MRFLRFPVSGMGSETRAVDAVRFRYKDRIFTPHWLFDVAQRFLPRSVTIVIYPESTRRECNISAVIAVLFGALRDPWVWN